MNKYIILGCILSNFATKLLSELGVDYSDKNKNTVNVFFEEEYRMGKIRIIFRELSDKYHSKRYGYTISKEECMRELRMSKENLYKLIKSGKAPDNYKLGDAPKSPRRFTMIGVAEFLSGYRESS